MDSKKMRWMNLWKEMGAVSGAMTVYEKLTIRYSEPHRAYHTLAHISECLDEFDRSRRLATHPAEIEAAIWFHDVIYDIGAADNEEKSAALAYDMLIRHKVSKAVAKRVSDLVLATKHSGHTSGGDAELIIDIDLAILGQPMEKFDRYEEQIRQEYRHIPENLFKQTRADILKAFLSRDTIYLTDFFRDRYEKIARENLRYSIQRLAEMR